MLNLRFGEHVIGKLGKGSVFKGYASHKEAIDEKPRLIEEFFSRTHRFLLVSYNLGILEVFDLKSSGNHTRYFIMCDLKNDLRPHNHYFDYIMQNKHILRRKSSKYIASCNAIFPQKLVGALELERILED